MGISVDAPLAPELTTDEVATILRRHRKTVEKLIRSEKILARREGRHYRISEGSLRAYIASTYPPGAA